MNNKDIVFYGGVGVVVGSHLYMLTQSPTDEQKYHALINLGAVGVILYSCYM